MSTLTDAEIRERILALVDPLLDSSNAPGWAIQVAHAVMYWNEPNARLARSEQPSC